MITRLFIDNFRCFVEFEIKPTAKQLIIGRNGNGKSTLFETLLALRRFVVDGDLAENIFDPESRTRWQSSEKQKFELDVSGNGGVYRYSLSVKHRGIPPRPCVVVESLDFDSKPIFVFKNGEVHLYNDRHEDKTQFPYDVGRSGLATVVSRPENKRLTWFKQWLARLYCLKIDPRRMTSVAEKEFAHPSVDFDNFAGWYRHIVQQETAVIRDLFPSLSRVIDGFDSLELKDVGLNKRVLEAKFILKAEDNGKSPKRQVVSFNFDELSDGQRALVGLYTLLHSALTKDSTICIDEPDNFVSLQEIQPWIYALLEKLDNNQAQALLISHHPEFINQLAPADGILFERLGDGRIAARPFQGDPGGILPPSEQVARGWDRG
ncbi:MAG: AAA family ATPase [Planctomycetes bacterium]|nr:AAA family ATPase [Planctomycetota bacterium]MBI3846562.1 AAA family ATPase [Planctomycetota bacterium]